MKEKKHDLGRWFVGFGIFLFGCGVIGFTSNPSAAKTALISGGTFGSLSAVWGCWLLKGGKRIPYFGAGVTTLVLCAAFTWRAAVSWQAVSRGEPKVFAAVLISAMLAGSLLSVIRLIIARKGCL